MEVVLVPPGGPRTKPKALDFGLTMARGDVVTIFDAEDQPESLQLRRAAIALGEAGPRSPVSKPSCRLATIGKT